MSDWRAGELAVCIVEPHPRSTLKLGGVYTVSAVTPWRTWDGGDEDVGLMIGGHRHWSNVSGHFFAGCFRKVAHDKHEQCEPEFVTLLKRIKQPAPIEAASDWLLRAGPIAKELNEQSRKDQ